MADRVGKWELDQARLNVVNEVRQCVRDGVDLPEAVEDAFVALAALEQRDQEQQEAARRANLAVEMHYVGQVDARHTLCGIKINDRTPHGWVGKDNEFLNRRLDNGGVACPRCLAMAT